MAYRKLPDRLRDPYPLLRELRRCREALGKAQREVKPMGVTYHGLAMAEVAIDALATLLTGQRYYFSDLAGAGSRPEEVAAEAEKLARERGETPK